MRQFRLSHELPELTGALITVRSSAADRTKSEHVLDALRQLGDRCRGDKPLPFYPVREVAECFGVPVSLVARVYRQLEAEGLLLRIRSVGTMLQPKRRQPRQAIRGVVGLPVWQYGHSQMPDWQIFFRTLAERLRIRHFLADFVFYRAGEEFTSALEDRLLDYHLDHLVWFKPLGAGRELMRTLADKGVRIAVVTEGQLAFPGRRYIISWDRALRRGVAQWKARGIRRVLVCRALDPVPYDATDPEALLEAAGMACEQHPQPGTSVTIAPAALDRRTAVLIWDNLFCTASDTLFAAGTAALLKEHPVICTHHLNTWPDLVAGVRSDFAILNWTEIADRVADDIARGQLTEHREPVTFQARWHPQADAARFARQF